MSIWCSYDPSIGWDDEGPELGWQGGEVRSYADGWSNHYPDGTAEFPATIDLASIAPWCVPGHMDESPLDGREVGPWLRLSVESPLAFTWWVRDEHGNPTPAPESATVVMDEAAVRALVKQLKRWLKAEHVQPKEPE